MVSIVRKTPDGLHICPHCGDEYEPIFETKEKAKEEGRKVAVEQHLTGTCSDECWKAQFGEPPDMSE